MATTIVYNRDTSKDILSTVYTDSTTLIVGMPIYNDVGADTCKDIKNINNDTFDIDEMIKLSFIKGTGVNTYTIDENTYTTDSDVLLSVNNTHTLTVTGGTSSHNSLSINGYGFGLTSTCTFYFEHTVDGEIFIHLYSSESAGYVTSYDSSSYTLTYTGGGSIR